MASHKAKKKFVLQCAGVQEHFITLNLLRATVDKEEEIISAKDKIIQMLESKITLLENEKDGLVSIIDTVKTYAGVAKMEATNANHLLFISSVKEYDCSVTRSEFRSKVNPIECAVGLSKLKNGKNGSIIMECSSKTLITKMKTASETNLGDQYECVK
ncbi:hypothetical protein HHI36_012468 [Cryptolaemus montrouzieri]|uniref:Uncharacterized protein n=1 Tax=Cryptolaemus montrouzieri TaxID=559131 RepID=A0ABD2NEB4_9CUCU